MIADREFDALLRSVLADEAASVEEMAPSLEHAVATLRPRVQSRAGGTRRLVLVLAAACLLVALVVSAVAVGAWLKNKLDEHPPRIYSDEFRAVGLLPAEAPPQAIIGEPDGSALLIGIDRVYRFDPVTARFAQVGTLQINRVRPPSVALQDGRVLIIGGGHDWGPGVRPEYPAEIFDPSSGMSTLVGFTVNPCEDWCTATLLDNGNVLIVGGNEPELFDPGKGFFVEIGASGPRQYSAAVLLDDGRVLIIGGQGSDGPPSAELYDTNAGTFAPAGPMAVPQVSGFAVSKLTDGRILTVGGFDESGNALAAAQLYDPTSNQFTRTGSLPAPRVQSSAAVLADGRVLIVGGWDSGEDAVAQGDDAFTYDPATGAFTPTASLSVQRLAPFVVTLSDGRVLVAGSRCWNNGCYGLDALPGAANREISAEVFE